MDAGESPEQGAADCGIAPGRVSQSRVQGKAQAAPQQQGAPSEIPADGGGPLGVLVVDPPGQYDVRAQAPPPQVATPYPPMSLEELKKGHLPLLADSAILWLWTTNAPLEEAVMVAPLQAFHFSIPFLSTASCFRSAI